jgi:hypothetical protein
MAVGQTYPIANSNAEKVLVQNNPSGSTLAIGAALKFTSGSASSYVVDATTAATDVCIGVADNPTTTVPAGSYFWMSTKGFCSPLVANGTAFGKVLEPSGTAGVLQATAGDNQGNISSAAAQSGGGNTQTLCWFQ